MPRKATFISLLLCCACTLPVFSQAHPAWAERGRQAFAEERYEDARYAYQWIIDREPRNAEALYMMAKILWMSGEDRQAARFIERALRYEPEKVPYLELQLEIGFPAVHLYVLRETKMIELADKILGLDSTSVVANTHRGVIQAHQWAKWRNRITVSGSGARPSGLLGGTRSSRGEWSQANHLSQNEGARGKQLAEVFSIDRLRDLGHNVQDLSTRGEKAYPDAVVHLQRAIAADPAHVRASEVLAGLYIARGEDQALFELAKQLQQQLEEDYRGWLWAGFVEHEANNEEEAERYFHQALSLMPDSIRAVYEDPTRILNKVGLKDFENAGAFFEEDFWQVRDPRWLSEVNERQLEHYARLVYASLVFSEPDLELAGWDSDRGRIYIRYGHPEIEFFLSNAVVNCGPFSYNNFHIFEYGQFRFVFANPPPNALNEYVIYSPCAEVFARDPAAGKSIDYQIISGEVIRETPEQYNYNPSGTRTQFPYLTSLFKGENGGVDIIIPYGIPVLTKPAEGDLSIPMHAGAFLFAENQGLVNQNRRSFSRLPAGRIFEFDGANVWIDAHSLNAAPGEYEVSVEFETVAGDAVGFHRSTVNAPDYADLAFRMSDVMLAYSVETEDAEADTPGFITRRGHTIMPAPWGVFKQDQPLYLYFELYNLQRNPNQQTRYEIEAVMISQAEEGGLVRRLQEAFRRRRLRDGVSVRFESTGTSRDEGQYLIMDTSGLEAGVYVLAVRVLDAVLGATVESSRKIEIY